MQNKFLGNTSNEAQYLSNTSNEDICLLCSNESSHSFHGVEDKGVYSYYLCSSCTSKLKRRSLSEEDMEAIKSETLKGESQQAVKAIS